MPAVVKQRTSAKPYTTAPGKGKQKKVFPEEQGLAALLKLSQSIAGEKAGKLDAKAQVNKEKVKAIERKRQEDKQRKKEKLAKQEEGRAISDGPVVKSKAEIKADLKSSQREKAKARKEARKNRNTETPVESPAPESTPSKGLLKKPSKGIKGAKVTTRKNVSFALP